MQFVSNNKYLQFFSAIPSGVGFLGSALIFKNKDDENNVHEVHGLTTAASVWLSAAVGIACAGGLYFVASLSVAIMLVLLRFGPRTNFPTEDEEDEENLMGDNSMQEDIDAAIAIANMNASKKQHYHATEASSPEKDKLIPRMSQHSQRSAGGSASRRHVDQRPSLI